MKIFVVACTSLLAQTQASLSGGKGEHSETDGVDGKPQVTNNGHNPLQYEPEIRDYIVQKHNWARANLVPTGQAANMRFMEWNEDLAISAANWVSQCSDTHFTEDDKYGQNLEYGGETMDKAAWDRWMKGWVDDEITEEARKSDGMLELNHASAVLWADSFMVGCASKKCPRGYLTACNYFTVGNIRGEKAYQHGTPCSQCPPQAPYPDASGKLCAKTKGAGANSTLPYNGDGNNGGDKGGKSGGNDGNSDAIFLDFKYGANGGANHYVAGTTTASERFQPVDNNDISDAVGNNAVTGDNYYSGTYGANYARYYVVSTDTNTVSMTGDFDPSSPWAPAVNNGPAPQEQPSKPSPATSRPEQPSKPAMRLEQQSKPVMRPEQQSKPVMRPEQQSKPVMRPEQQSKPATKPAAAQN
ncbi:TPA: hypothetical protein N0F65_006142 [Lagenidium giganteum]|uniref:SCP domain-containing protein n=1 Tax=Lagenidium giganteum TaxID=4803 RepID=A0AAV2Z673_9STRA|nr:TPA: hypothetical protein N0F65_006142 [Lagenidium giganteum]